MECVDPISVQNERNSGDIESKIVPLIELTQIQRGNSKSKVLCLADILDVVYFHIVSRPICS
jgi:hypothetical protein